MKLLWQNDQPLIKSAVALPRMSDPGPRRRREQPDVLGKLDGRSALRTMQRLREIKIDVLVDCARCAPLHQHFVYDCRNAACVKESIHRECYHCNGNGIVN
ncbi:MULTISPECIES: hypothetical protein [unclassified Bradyrhizobium]|uniref:hypothetical protein n=1 Tax=unclassified Bradyrhizobium TaxID=2631580 RepID=UPI00048E67F2|nr:MULTISPECIES: hypothetical protein [unclassified Bradyrhizobium]QIG94464.1 hypothetical protein G6P99_19690 [Bradyrhizobium sp. 6(2017)]